jgi:hypothetical protein
MCEGNYASNLWVIVTINRDSPLKDTAGNAGNRLHPVFNFFESQYLPDFYIQGYNYYSGV